MDALNAVAIGGLTLGDVLAFLLTLTLCVVARKLLMRLFDRVMARIPQVDPSLRTFLSGTVNVLLWSLVVIIAADKLGIPVSSLVALVSVAGVALSLSLQSVLANVFAGLTLLGTKPAQPGEYVEIGSTAGTVRQVGLFYTVLVTAEGKVIYLPNSTVLSSEITNHSDLPLRRVELQVSASYDDEPERVLEALLLAARTTPTAVTEEKPPVAYVRAYGASSIEYTLYIWTKNADFLRTRYDAMERIFYAFREKGVTMTYDHLNVHIIGSEEPEEEHHA